jgi:hypothetical protein
MENPSPQLQITKLQVLIIRYRLGTMKYPNDARQLATEGRSVNLLELGYRI